ncbi:replication initiation protein [Kineococcus auxinigenes]|uniref:replication initiation protein n=1 Tax=unclassified Kineococcus TaxID=2621656 RepID=UPI003D7D63C0
MPAASSVRMDAQTWTETWSPRRPLATDDLTRGCWRQSRDDALARRYLEHSPKALLSMLVIDVDHDDTVLRALTKPMTHPMPSWIAESSTGRGHVGWVLKTPVVRTDAARLEPMRYAAKVEEGLRRSLDGDVGYAGLLTKNPVHDDWVTTWGTGHLYELDELAKGLGELMPRTLPRRAVDSSGFGRNVTLFNRLRLWAYRARRRYDDRLEWEEVVAAFAANVNPEFAVPLPAQEVAQTAQSVARWVWRRSFDDAGFRAVQAQRGSNGGKKGGRANTPAQQEQRRRNAPAASLMGAAARRKVTATQMAEDLL